MNTNIEHFSYVRAGEEHLTFLVSPTGKNINLELEPEFLKRYELQEADFEKLTERPGSCYMMLQLYKELHFQDQIFSDSIEVLLLSLLHPQLSSIKRAVPRWAAITSELLCDNWNKELSLHQIALTANVHPVTVSKYFARYFGCSLGEHRRRLKIERAVQLMNSSDKSFSEIAHTCAFFDQSHFIKAFREATGFTPKQFVK